MSKLEYVNACIAAAKVRLATSQIGGWEGSQLYIRRIACVARRAKEHYDLATPRGEALINPSVFVTRR